MSNIASVSSSLPNNSYPLTNTAASATDWPTWILTPAFIPGNVQASNDTYRHQHHHYYHRLDDYDQRLLPTLYHYQPQWHAQHNTNNVQHPPPTTPPLHPTNTHGYVNAEVPETGNEMPPLTPTVATTDNNADDLIHNELVQIFFCMLYTTVFVLGVFGNVLVCYVVLRNRAMQTVTNIFITNLALSDILLCVLAVPFTPLYTFMGRWAFGRTLCHLVSFAQGCSIYISTLTLTSIAIDRYFVIIYPFHPRMKLSTCIAIIVSIWVIAVLATLPYGMYMKVISADSLLTMAHNNESTTIDSIDTLRTEQKALNIATFPLFGRNVSIANTTVQRNITNPYMHHVRSTSTASSLNTEETYYDVLSNDSNNNNSSLDTIHYCEENWPSEHYRKVFGSLTTILQFVLPFVIISICYIWISMKLSARAKAKPGSKSSRKDEADRDRKKRTNRMLIAMVAVFGLSWLPLNVVNMFDDFYEKSNEWRYYTLFFFVAHSIAMSSTCYNPFLYAWLNENFRKEFKHVLPCFNPSPNNTVGGRGFNRSDRNTCGPRLHHGNGGNAAAGSLGHGGSSLDQDDYNNMDDENGITQDTCLNITTAKEKLLIIPREPTYGNGRDNNALSPCSDRGISGAVAQSAKQVEILLTDTISYKQPQQNQHDQSKSGEIMESRFTETPFISSDTHTSISIMETTSTTKEMEDRSTTTNDVDKHWPN